MPGDNLINIPAKPLTLQWHISLRTKWF